MSLIRRSFGSFMSLIILLHHLSHSYSQHKEWLLVFPQLFHHYLPNHLKFTKLSHPLFNLIIIKVIQGLFIFLFQLVFIVPILCKSQVYQLLYH